jgi:two-component system cell cycle sensor histidine kinase/response regulator CckA
MDRMSTQTTPRNFKDNGRAGAAERREPLRMGRLESFAALAGGAMHEMSNLLATVLMSVEILRGDFRAASEREVLAALEQITRRGLGVTRQLQWLAGGVECAPTLFQPRFLIADLQVLVGATFPRSLVVTTSYTQDLWLLQGDPLLLYQSLLDLLLDARNSLAGNGEIELAARNERLDLGAGGGGVPHVAFEVSARLPPATVSHAHGRNGGAATEAAGPETPPPSAPSAGAGRIGWEALRVRDGARQPGFASRGFDSRFWLPAADVDAEADPAVRAAEPRRGGGELVLVADEEAALCDMVAAVLEQFGYRALTVRQAAAFDERLGEVAVVLASPEAAARALAMVGGPSGAERGARVVLMDGGPDPAGGGAAVALRKPFTTTQLLASLAAVLGDGLAIR